VSEFANQRDFVPKLHATADKARVQQPQRGRPPKANSAATGLNTTQSNGGASATAI